MSPFTVVAFQSPTDSTAATNNLYKVGEIFYFRTRLPQDLLEIFGGKQEIKRSLRTRSLKQAKRLLKVWTARTEEVFTTMRGGALTRDQIKRLADAYLHDTLRKHEEDRLCGSGVPQGPGEVRERIKQNLDRVTFLQSALTHYLQGSIAEEVTAYLAEHQGLEDVDPESLEFKLLAREILHKKIEVIRVENERLQGNYANGWDDRQELPSPRLSQPVAAPEVPGVLIGECVKRYIADYHKSDRARPQSISEYEATCRLFQDFMGNKEMSAVTRDDMRAFRDALKRLPRHKGKVPAYRDKSIPELLEMEIPEEHRLSSTSIGKRLDRVMGLLKWAVQEEIINKNPGEGLNLVVRQQKGYLPFDQEELQGMVRGFLEAARQGDLDGRPERIWLPLISLFAGARVNEIAQLHIGDVCQEPKSGIWYFKIEATEEDEEVVEDGEGNKTLKLKTKSVKNSSSHRAIPVHPTLEALGFLEYVRSLKESGSPRLWMNLNQSAATGKYHKSFTNWFLKTKHSEGFKCRYMTTESRKVFHSFRKAYSNELKQKMVTDSVIKDLMGHIHGSITFDVYTQPHRLETMLEALKKMDFEVDFMPLKEILKEYHEKDRS